MEGCHSCMVATVSSWFLMIQEGVQVPVMPPTQFQSSVLQHLLLQG